VVSLFYRGTAFLPLLDFLDFTTTAGTLEIFVDQISKISLLSWSGLGLKFKK